MNLQYNHKPRGVTVYRRIHKKVSMFFFKWYREWNRGDNDGDDNVNDQIANLKYRELISAFESSHLAKI